MRELKARTIIEVLGRPKEHVDKALGLIKDKLAREDKNFELVKSEIFDARPVKDHENMFAGFVENDLNFKDLDRLMGFCFDYMPASIEIIEPKSLNFKSNDLSSFFNELQAKLHSLDIAIKQTRNENTHLKKNTHLLLNNVVNLMLVKKGHTAANLARTVGMPEDQMKIFLDKLVKNKKLAKDEDKYTLTKQ